MPLVHKHTEAAMVDMNTSYHEFWGETINQSESIQATAFSQAFTRMLMVNVSFHLDFGKQKASAKKRIDNSDTDTGILSGSK